MQTRCGKSGNNVAKIFESITGLRRVLESGEETNREMGTLQPCGFRPKVGGVRCTAE